MKIFSPFKVLTIACALFLNMPAIAATTDALSDSEITTEVKGKIFAQPGMSVLDIKVKTDNGVVALSGHVDSENQASDLVQLVQSIDGVKDVETSNLSVKASKHPLTDSYITAKVKGLFLKEKLFGDKDIASMSIKVETTKGIVYLSGTADTEKEIDNAISLAETVKGVKSVKSNVKVSTETN